MERDRQRLLRFFCYLLALPDSFSPLIPTFLPWRCGSSPSSFLILIAHFISAFPVISRWFAKWSRVLDLSEDDGGESSSSSSDLEVLSSPPPSLQNPRRRSRPGKVLEVDHVEEYIP
ncbi:hypothetical protein RIF29_19773 [Crotalaria pallida]|uniref:Uncharacterized protein n=1 Tax=Crotalaria pallida TaxID=3830 RepID=A0AAN9F1V0_CROPI